MSHIVRLVDDMLDIENHKVRTVVNGQDGECLVLLDLQMPVMRGLELLLALENEPNMKVRKVTVIVLTAGRTEELNQSI